MTWLEFKTMVKELLPVDASRLNVATPVLVGGVPYLDRLIRLGVIDLQQFIPGFRKGHETVYDFDDFQEEGLASVGRLPDDALLRDAYYVTTGTPCHRHPLQHWPWDNRFDLVCGNAKSFNGQYFISIDPQAKDFVVFPAVEEGKQVSLFWDSKVVDFDDDETVPLTEKAASAVALHCSAHIERKVKGDNLASSSYMLEYEKARTALYLDDRDRGRLANQANSPQSATSCAPVQPDDTLIEFVAFGNSGQNESDTAVLKEFAASFDPDFILHLGNCVWPNEDPVYIEPTLLKHFGQYAAAEKLYLAFGNRDLDADAGAPLMVQLSYLADLNAGALYYSFTVGECTFYVLNSNRKTNGDMAVPADGAGLGSAQWSWLQSQLAASDSTWNIVVLSTPPLSSDAAYKPGSAEWNLGYAAEGADLVLSAHVGNYERLLVNKIPYLISGLGGNDATDFDANPMTESQFRYNTKNGLIQIAANDSYLKAAFVNVNGETIDRIVLRK